MAVYGEIWQIETFWQSMCYDNSVGFESKGAEIELSSPLVAFIETKYHIQRKEAEYLYYGMH